MTETLNYERDIVLTQSTELTVQTISDRQRAADIWDAIRAFRKKAETQKEEVCRPFKTAWDDAKKSFDTFVKECQWHEATLQQKMGAWDREQDRLTQVEQARLQAIVDKANARIEAKAEERGVEAVLKVAPVVQAPARNIETQAGTVSARSEKKVYGVKDVADNEELKANDPRIASLIATFPALFVLDWVAFRKVASTGMLDAVPQVVSRIEYIYAQRRA